MSHLICISLKNTNGRDVCHQYESQTSTVCFASPGCKCSEHRCIKHLVGGSGLLCILSCTTHSKKVIEQVNTRCKMIAVAPQWPMMHWFWDLVNQSTKPSLQLLHWSRKQPFSQKYHQNLLLWYLHAWHLNTTQNHLNHSE